MNKQRGNKQQGFTLVELMVTVSTASVLLMLATGVVHSTMRFESMSRQRASVHRAAVRLSHDFRHDIHRANGFRISDRADKPPTIRLMLPEGSEVTYQVTHQRVLREQRLGAQQVAQQVARETYDFPANYRVMFSQSEPRMAELTVEHHLQLVGIDPQTVVHVQAEVGRLLRLEKVKEISP
ncbi:MAG: prepilin-type N-terminal cleavage/methylation domain-containing protein [Planctomycetes bacterium]|nr:prepilin-type N-terminal cleavage/methylation domain-containing protein [Planctomycetota bacterium]